MLRICSGPPTRLEEVGIIRVFVFTAFLPHGKLTRVFDDHPRWKLTSRNAGIRFDADSDLDGIQLHRYVQLLPGIQTLNVAKASKVNNGVAQLYYYIIYFYNEPTILCFVLVFCFFNLNEMLFSCLLMIFEYYLL